MRLLQLKRVREYGSMNIVQIVYMGFFKVYKRDVYKNKELYSWFFVDTDKNCLTHVSDELLDMFIESEENYYNVNR